MRRYGLLIVVLLVGAAYVAGYWPEHQQRMTLERERQGLQGQLAEAQARVRLGGLLGQLLAVIDAAAGGAGAGAGVVTRYPRADCRPACAWRSWSSTAGSERVRLAVTESLARRIPSRTPRVGASGTRAASARRSSKKRDDRSWAWP